jgi:hypothetical protein
VFNGVMLLLRLSTMVMDISLSWPVDFIKVAFVPSKNILVLFIILSSDTMIP